MLTDPEQDARVVREAHAYAMRAKWPAGPWDDEPDEKWWPVDPLTGVQRYALRNPEQGNWCGYVKLPARHPLVGVDTRDLGHLACHGGITWSAQDPDGGWSIGFDCGHAHDIAPGMMAMLQEAETESANSLFGQMMQGLRMAQGWMPTEAEAPPSWAFVPRYRTLDYVEDETLLLAAQVSRRVRVPRGRPKRMRVDLAPPLRATLTQRARLWLEDYAWVEYPATRRVRVPRGPQPLSVRYLRR